MASPSSDCQLPASLLEPARQATQDGDGKKSSYGEILKSSAVIGGSSVLNIAIGIVRTKAMAVLLGPAGFGMAGLYGSIADLTQNIAGMGVNSSGVRQIAEAVGTIDSERIARTVLVLRRTSVVLGVVGAVLIGIFSRQVSLLTFGTNRHAGTVALLSLVVLFRLVSNGQGALIQGMRRISDLAKMNVAGAIFGTAAGIPLVYFFRENGIVPYLISVAATSILASWWYSRKIQLPRCSLTLSEVGQEVGALLNLGFAFMISAMMTLGVAYANRVIVLRQLGSEATGLYQCAWMLGGLYVSFILQAMAADFYPRLTASINDHTTSNRLVNEQAQVGLLLAGPGVIATLTFAPAIIGLLYSGKFAASAGILRWICLGATLQVVSWPMGFIIVAKGKQSLFILSEVAWALVSITLSWTCVTWFGVTGTGIAFFCSYMFHALFTYLLVRPVIGFRWSLRSTQIAAVFLPVIGVVFSAFYVASPLMATCAGAVALLVSCIYSIRAFLALFSWEQIPRPVRRLALALGISSGPTATASPS